MSVVLQLVVKYVLFKNTSSFALRPSFVLLRIIGFKQIINTSIGNFFILLTYLLPTSKKGFFLGTRSFEVSGQNHLPMQFGCTLGTYISPSICGY